MADALFADSSLATVYDAFEGDRDDLTVYVGIAEELRADRVLDVGCGTGSLAVLLADSGRTVVGVDPAEASLVIAKSKDPTGRIAWVHGDATAVPALNVDLAVMTGNVAQVFLTDEDWTRTLDSIRTSLRPGDIWCSRPGVRNGESGRTGPQTLIQSSSTSRESDQ